MRIETLDHVALWVRDRDVLTEFLTASLGMHVVERTDRFTLVGSDARRGKLTLFAADGERQRGALVRVGLGARDLDAAVSMLPAELELDRRDGEVRFEARPARFLSLDKHLPLRTGALEVSP